MLSPPRLIRWIVSLAVLFLGVMTLLRVGTFFSFMADRVPLAQTWAAFWLGFRFDGRMVASAMLPLLVLGGLSFLDVFNAAFGRRLWLGLLGVCSAVLLVFYVADFLHYRYLNQRLNASVLGFFGDAAISARMVWQTYPVGWIGLGLFVAWAGLMAVIVSLHRRVAAVTVTLRKPARVAWFVAALLGCLLSIFGRAGQYPLRWSDAFALRNDALANLALNPVQSFLSSLDFRTSGCEVAKVREHYPFMSAYLGVTAPDAEHLSFERRVAARPGVAPIQPNVVLVICESFSAYKSSMWGNALDTTPFFNGLCQQGLFFDNCFTPHYGTARGVWATITGIPDVEAVETASRNPALVDQHTIINDFIGYEKLYFIGGSTSWANIRGLLTNNIKGLQLYEENSYTSPRVDVWGISDMNLFREANAVLRRQTSPFFAVIQTADNHRPYTIPKEDLVEFSKLDVPVEMLQRGGFDSLEEMNAFRYTDHCFKKFFEAARQAEYFANTIFIFVGDHGIDGNAGTMFPLAWTENKLTSYHVPLLFYGPRFLAPQRVHSVASMVDILPTLAGLVNIPYRNNALGRDLLWQQQRDGGASNAAFIIDRHDRWVGLIQGQHFGHHRLDGTRPELAWADFRLPPPAAATVPRDDYPTLTNAFFETARYLLLHNQKLAAEK
jgi:glucan phosphoethanolaminetransferase (alkaline phosphatase superfamily)